jgi:hypothetical protein
VAERTRFVDRLLTPRRVFGSIALLLVIALLLIPTTDAEQTADLSSFGAMPNGARGIHDVLQRLGYRVERRLRPMRTELDTAALYVMLLPPLDPTAGEVHRLLQAVRGGARLLVVPTPGSRMTDSLRITPAPALPRRRTANPSSPFPTDTADHISTGWLRFVLRRAGRMPDSARVLRPPPGTRTFLWLETEKDLEPMALGMSYGRGRLVIAADPDLFRNSVIRGGDGAVRAMRIFEWLLAGRPQRPIIFDEYHHGYGTHVDLARVTQRALRETRPGRTVLQLAVAAFVLLLAVAVRPIKPAPRLRIERRSPLEHVGALARAYAAAGATARVTRLLVHGLRRRHGGVSARDDTAYLQSIRQRHPDVDADVDIVNAALEESAAHGIDTRISAAIQHIEQAITT